jgi:SCP-2 sterol transfer family protein
MSRSGSRPRSKTLSSRSATVASVETLVRETFGKLSHEIVARGGVHIHVTGASAAEFHVSAHHDGVRVHAGPPTDETRVRISGPERRIRALLDGKKHPTAAFVEGGIEVAGDARQIARVADALPVLTLKRARAR